MHALKWLVDEQGGVPVTVLQAAEVGWLHVVRSKLEKAVADDDSVPEMLAETDYAGRTPLHLACMNGHVKVIGHARINM